MTTLYLKNCFSISGLGEAYGGPQVTPQDLIEKTNKGLNDLAKEVDEKLSQVKGK